MLNDLIKKINTVIKRGKAMAAFIESLEMESAFKDRLLEPWALACGELIQSAENYYYEQNREAMKREAVRSLDDPPPIGEKNDD